MGSQGEMAVGRGSMQSTLVLPQLLVGRKGLLLAAAQPASRRSLSGRIEGIFIQQLKKQFLPPNYEFSTSQAPLRLHLTAPVLVGPVLC